MTYHSSSQMLQPLDDLMQALREYQEFHRLSVQNADLRGTTGFSLNFSPPAFSAFIS